MINHPDEGVFLRLTLEIDDANPAQGIEPCAVAVLEGLAYVIPLDVDGELHPMLVLTEIDDFPPEAEDAPVAKWWREAMPKRDYVSLRALIEADGVESAITTLYTESARHLTYRWAAPN
jgi:hypothetical protein